MNSMYLAMSAWREILARTFTGFSEQINVSPDWLVNPATRRKLKLDVYYPEVGVAIRFIGLTAKGQGRQSDWEVMETEQRDQTRAELCRENGVQLVTVDPNEDLVKQVDGFLSALARASRALAQGTQPDAYKAKWMPDLAAARARAEKVRAAVVKDPEQMTANLAEGWRDREAGIAVELSGAGSGANGQAGQAGQSGQNGQGKPRPKTNLVLTNGQRVRHLKFGDGVITRIEGSGDETKITILFDAAEERTFQANLVADKLEAA